jgi:hypothetical protein
MICKKCIHKEVCKHKSKSVYECEHFKELVMCKECKYYMPIKHQSIKWKSKVHYCTRKCNVKMFETDFCSRGERKESEVTE